MIKSRFYWAKMKQNNSPELLNLLFKHLFHRNSPKNNQTSHKLFFPLPPIGAPLEAALGPHWGLGPHWSRTTSTDPRKKERHLSRAPAPRTMVYKTACEMIQDIRNVALYRPLNGANGGPMGGKGKNILYDVWSFFELFIWKYI